MRNYLYTLVLACTAMLGIAAHADSYNGYTLTDEGAWCWFADPRAIHYENESGTINASYIGYIDVHGNVKAMQMDFLTGRRDEVLVRSYFQPDDHNNPTFLVLPDERVLIIYSRHTDEAAFYYRVSRVPGDITTFGAEHRLATANNTTYPSPFLMSDDPEHFYLCWRGIGWHPTIARLTLPDDNDEVRFDWGPYQMVQSTGARPYAKYYSNGKDKIYVTYTTGHPDNEQPNWVYFNVININGGNKPTLNDIKGNQLSVIENGKFNVNKTDTYRNQYPYTIVDSPSNYRDWVWQTVLDTDGNPVIAMVRITGGKDQHEYFYAKWTGSQWRLTDLADGGGRFHSSNTEYCYSGGEALDPQNPNIIYLSIPTQGDYGKVYEIWKYTLDAQGAVASKEQITRNSVKNNVRPYVLPGSEGSPLRLGWMNGDYYYWIVQKNYPLGYPTSIQCDYNWVEDSSVPAIAYDGEAEFASALSQFTINANVKIDSSNYGGEILDLGAVKFGLDKTSVLPYVIINGTRYDSSNKLYTSDSWAANSSGTSGDNWASPLGDFSTTISYDGNNLKVYRNGLLDQNIPVSGLSISGVKYGDFTGTKHALVTYDQALTSEQIKGMIRMSAIEQINLPSILCTDLVLPTKVNGSAISWSTSNPEIIAANGTFRAPEAETEVSLVASIQGTSKTYTLTAYPRNIESNLLAYFDFETFTAQDGVKTVTDANGCEMKVYGNASVDGTLNLTANTATGFANNGYAVVSPYVMDGLRSYTIMLDACPSSLDKQPRIYDFGYNSGNSLFLRANALSAGIKYSGGTTTMITSTTPLVAGKNHKVAVTFDARDKETRIYLDGELISSGTDIVNEPYMLAENALCVRNYVGRTQWWDSSYANDNGDYVGTIDNFRIYNIALTPSEIREIQGFREPDASLNIDYSSAIINRDFEGGYAPMANSGVTSDRAIYVPENWTAVYTNRNENDMTVLGSNDLYANLFSAIPTNQGGGTKAFLARQKWGTSTIGLEQVCDTLSAGYYAIGGDLWQSGLGGQGTIWAKPATGDKASATGVANLAAWQQTSVNFICDGVESVTFGVTAMHNSNGDEKFLGFDNITLYDVTANCTESELLDLLAKMIKAADTILATQEEGAIKNALASASAAAKTADAGSDYDELMTLYKDLREALRMKKGTSGIRAISVDTDCSELPVFDLSGRKILEKGTKQAIKTLAPGIYLQGNSKIYIK